MKYPIYELVKHQEDSQLRPCASAQYLPIELKEQFAFQLSDVLFRLLHQEDLPINHLELLKEVALVSYQNQLIEYLNVIFQISEMDQTLIEKMIETFIYQSTELCEFQCGLLLTYFSQKDYQEVYLLCAHNELFLPYIQKAIEQQPNQQERLLQLYEATTEELKLTLIHEMIPFQPDYAKRLFYSLKPHHHVDLAMQIMLKPTVLFNLGFQPLSKEDQKQFTLYLIKLINADRLFDLPTISLLLPIYIQQLDHIDHADELIIVHYIYDYLRDDDLQMGISDDEIQLLVDQLQPFVFQPEDLSLITQDFPTMEMEMHHILNTLEQINLQLIHPYVLPKEAVQSYFAQRGLNDPLLEYLLEYSFDYYRPKWINEMILQYYPSITPKDYNVVTFILMFYKQYAHVNQEVILYFLKLEDYDITATTCHLIGDQINEVSSVVLGYIKEQKEKGQHPVLKRHYDYVLLTASKHYTMGFAMEDLIVPQESDTLLFQAPLQKKEQYSSSQTMERVQPGEVLYLFPHPKTPKILIVMNETGIVLGEVPRKESMFLQLLLENDDKVYAILEDDLHEAKPKITFYRV